jgi:hypothetical protein
MAIINLIPVAATIAAGQSLSNSVDLLPSTLVGLWMPASWTAASLTFQVSPDGDNTWLELVNYAGSNVTLTVAAGQFIQIDPTQWKGIYSVKLRSGTLASPVTQAASASIQLIGRQMVA